MIGSTLVAEEGGGRKYKPFSLMHISSMNFVTWRWGWYVVPLWVFEVWMFKKNHFLKCDKIQIAVCPWKLQWQWPLVLLKYSYIGKRNSVMVSIFECINHWKMFLFTFLMINLIARLITCHFFSYLFLWCYLKFIFTFIILLEFKMAASYFESYGFAD